MFIRLGDDMNLVIITLSLVIVIGLISILLVATYNHFQDYIIRINEADVNIDAVLRKRFDLLKKASGIIKANLKEENNVLDQVSKLRSKKLNNFEFDRQLYEAINEFHVIKETYPELQTNEEFLKIEINLMESESEIVGLRKYYNDIITDYNKLVKSFPSNLISILKKYKPRDYFDGSNIDKIKGAIKL